MVLYSVLYNMPTKLPCLEVSNYADPNKNREATPKKIKQQALNSIPTRLIHIYMNEHYSFILSSSLYTFV
jgi:hypothetical protein